MNKFFLRQGEENDATRFYLKLIEQAIISLNEKVVKIYFLGDINKEDKIITVSIQAFAKVYFHNPRQYIINWFQGIAPEEVIMLLNNKGGIKKYGKKYIFTLLEKLALKKSKLTFMVSHSMLKHYERKYHLKLSHYIIIPCFNQLFDPTAFDTAKYQRANFVYAGGILPWQCVERTFNIYKEIQNNLPDSTLTVLTGDQEKATELITKLDLKNVVVKYVNNSELNKELRHYKYGFLIRENNIVNNVATPTKMNSYMAAGVIPIVSDVIDDFRIFSDDKYVIKLAPDMSDHEIVEEILEFEQNKVEGRDIMRHHKKMFDHYYSVEKYIKLIEERLK